MKSVVRIFNFIIMGISAVAMLLLFTTSTFTFNSCVGLKAEYFNNFNSLIPASVDVGTIDVPYVLGTDNIYLSLKCDLGFGEVNTLMGTSNNELVNKELIENNIGGVFADLHEPIDILTEYTVRTALKKIAHDELAEQITNALTGAGHAATTEDVMDEMGMNDNYFRGFAKLLYDVGNTQSDPENIDQGPTIDAFTDVIFNKIKEILAEAKEVTAGSVDESYLTEDKKAQIKDGFVSIFNDIGLIMDDTVHIYRVSKVSYLFLAKFIKQDLQSKVPDPSILDKKTTENYEKYAERLSVLFVETLLPTTFYTLVSYICLGIFIGIILIAAIWAILLIFTTIRTFSSDKPWTFFGPWFWVVGSLQIVLGIGLTIFGKYILPKMPLPLDGTPISSFAVAPRTFALIPSILFIVMIGVAIAYLIISHPVKKEYKNKRNGRGPKPKEVVIHE